MPEISKADFIAETRKSFGDDNVVTLLDALETVWGNGFSDEEVGEADWAEGHCFRVARWTVWTSSTGYRSVSEYENDAKASESIEAYAGRLSRLEALNALTDAAHELGTEGRLVDPSDSDVLIYAAELAEADNREIELPDLAKLEPVEVRQIIDAYDRGTGL